jgi:hypothetical protein
MRTWRAQAAAITLALAQAACALADEPAGLVIEGEPWTRHAVDNTFDGADGVKLKDVNNDGRPDITTGWEEGGVVRVYLHPLPEKVRDPWPSVTVGAVESPEDAVFADVDADGAVDVISATEGNNKSLYVHWAPAEAARYLDPAAWETTAIPASQGVQWMFLLPAQINGGSPDLIAAGKNENAAIGWFEVPEAPRNVAEWKWHSLRQAGWVMSIRLLDMNADGELDIVYGDRKGPSRGIWWLQNPGIAQVAESWTPQLIGTAERDVMFLDYKQEASATRFTAAISGGGILSLTRASADADWQRQEIPMPQNTGTGKGVAIGDLDHDGIDDLAVTCENAKDKHGVFWLKRDGEHLRAQAISGLPGTKFDLIELVDLDEDGDLDLLTCEEREKIGVIWYENPVLPLSPGRL